MENNKKSQTTETLKKLIKSLKQGISSPATKDDEREEMKVKLKQLEDKLSDMPKGVTKVVNKKEIVVKPPVQDLILPPADVVECKKIISESQKELRNKKLSNLKHERICKVNEKLLNNKIDKEGAEEEIKKIQELTYTEVFAPKKPLSDKLSGQFVKIFDTVIQKIAYDIRNNPKIFKEKRAESLKKKADFSLARFVTTIIPSTHRLYLPEASKSGISSFKKEAEKIIEKRIKKIDNSLEK